MSKINYQYDLQNLTPANASPVEANFTRTEDHINQELIERDGSVAMRAQLKLAGDPVAALDAAPKQYVDQVIPVGLVMMWAAAAAPSNGRWLLCDGAAVQTAAWPELFAVIGYAWGGAGGSFNVPNFGGRMPVGTNGAHPMAQQGGSEIAALPAHVHGMSHAHGNTSAIDLNHLHAGVDHLHGAGGLVANAVGNHVHGEEQGQAFLSSGPPAAYFPFAGPPPGSFAFGTPANTAGGGAHGHSIGGSTGAADRALTTGWMDRSNVHDHTTPAFNGNVTQTGVDPATANMPPFLSIPYIIRAK